ncbi:efflux RND transporter periplasmic adaptor subunit [Tautonia plasticadhaerens]|uniref:Cobalt-zinc-cadmium resistance protein CzcB n=1 Tax=Tautonia plasticadhaerens TaxID=2527974 RepID=A0A518HES1_9BACT|nr:efflux RND transporter periplasmic adaptor subunit [Tautonia plasticadhaerens]QDV39334.1 Cobalt-zinc-cadmium resistance protein CzcB [Tautonia plasticadhaerens]
MKRIVFITAPVLAAMIALGLGVAVARPSWLPPWARIDPGRLPAWARIGAEVPATAEAFDYGLYCKEHGVPEKFCTLCHPELEETLLLCPEHGGIPEDICTLCHPEVEEKYDIVICPEHGLPEHFCVRCGDVPDASAALPDDGWCVTHNTPEALCADCLLAPEALATGAGPRVCRQPLPDVRLDSEDLAERIGLRAVPVGEERHAHHAEANAETAYDGNRHAEIYPRVAGFLHEIRVDLGDEVRPGDVLAVVDSAEVSGAKSRLISARAALDLARVEYERTRTLAERNAVASKQVLEAMTAQNQAEAAALDAAQTLRNLGFSDEDLGRIEAEKDTSSTLEVVSPIGGSVIFRHAVLGEAVQPTTKLFGVADKRAMWLWIDVYEHDIDRVVVGQRVTFSASGARLRADAPSHSGTVTWVGSEVDETTRTTRVRAELEDPGGRLRANVFGRARIRVEPEHDALVIPKDALQRHERADLVFLPLGAGRFRPQRVVTRPTDAPGLVEVAWGLEPGQEVVTDAAFLLKTEIMKGAIGAGCCE